MPRETDKEKLYRRRDLMMECVAYSEEIIMNSFGELTEDNRKLAYPMAIEMFRNVMQPDQLASIEKVLAWWAEREEKSKAESREQSKEFRASMPPSIMPRKKAPIEQLIENLLDFVSGYAHDEMKRIFPDSQEGNHQE